MHGLKLKNPIAVQYITSRLLYGQLPQHTLAVIHDLSAQSIILAHLQLDFIQELDIHLCT